jgi:hypothetical protein
MSFDVSHFEMINFFFIKYFYWLQHNYYFDLIKFNAFNNIFTKRIDFNGYLSTFSYEMIVAFCFFKLIHTVH